jgi:HK97 family phage prohead protease
LFRSAPKGADEIRSFNWEIRSDSGRKVAGYPIVFLELSQDLGGYRERILPDAVEFDVGCYMDFNHSPDFILGRVAAGTLTLTTDTKGVRAEALAPDTTWANDLLVSIRRRDITAGSFAFRVKPGGERIIQERGQEIRELSSILVRAVSVVANPAYLGTSIQVRSGGPGLMSRATTAELAALLRRKQGLIEMEY